MKTSTEYPPNYNEIIKVFPNLENHKPIFTYGETIYNPFKAELRPDIEHHESIHTKQQGDYPEVWWYQYLTDIQFRKEQEIEAYGEQLLFAKQAGAKGKLYDWIKEKIAQALSGELYKLDITYQEAESKIRNYVKTNS